LVTAVVAVATCVCAAVAVEPKFEKGRDIQAAHWV
jgi:hypothetical protein